MDSRKHIQQGAARHGRSNRRAHTLVEVITVVLILSILALVAVPRLNLAALNGARADAVAHRMATDLRRARAHAILHAARNPTGFAVVMNGEETYDGYQIVDLQDSTVIAAGAIPEGVACTGGRRFEFGPLGNLRSGSDTKVRVATAGKTYTLVVAPATGAVKWIRHGD